MYECKLKKRKTKTKQLHEKNEKVNAKCLGENLISMYLMYLRQATFKNKRTTKTIEHLRLLN